MAVAVWKVPRHCPLVLLVGWGLSLALNIAINVEQFNVGRYGDCFGSKFENFIHWEGCKGSMQCNVEFGYQLSICSGTKENLDRVGRSQDLPNATDF
jgi:hypothetical protein